MVAGTAHFDEVMDRRHPAMGVVSLLGALLCRGLLRMRRRKARHAAFRTCPRPVRPRLNSLIPVPIPSASWASAAVAATGASVRRRR